MENFIMSNLYLYACSFGYYGHSSNQLPNKDYWEDNNSFGYILANSLNYNLVNRSIAGASNFLILSNILQDIKKNVYHKNDMVIIQWTHINRAPMQSGKTIMPHSTHSDDQILNQTANTYYRELYFDLQNLANIIGYTKYIESKLKCEYYYNFVDDHELFKNINNELYVDMTNNKNYISFDNSGIYKFLRSFKTNDVFFPCTHPSSLGHQKIAECYYENIKKKRICNV